MPRQKATIDTLSPSFQLCLLVSCNYRLITGARLSFHLYEVSRNLTLEFPNRISGFSRTNSYKSAEDPWFYSEPSRVPVLACTGCRAFSDTDATLPCKLANRKYAAFDSPLRYTRLFQQCASFARKLLGLPSQHEGNRRSRSLRIENFLREIAGPEDLARPSWIWDPSARIGKRIESPILIRVDGTNRHQDRHDAPLHRSKQSHRRHDSDAVNDPATARMNERAWKRASSRCRARMLIGSVPAGRKEDRSPALQFSIRMSVTDWRRACRRRQSHVTIPYHYHWPPRATNDRPVDRHPREFLARSCGGTPFTSAGSTRPKFYRLAQQRDFHFSPGDLPGSSSNLDMLEPESPAAAVNLRRGSSLRISSTSPTEGKIRLRISKQRIWEFLSRANPSSTLIDREFSFSRSEMAGWYFIGYHSWDSLSIDLWKLTYQVIPQDRGIYETRLRANDSAACFRDSINIQFRSGQSRCLPSHLPFRKSIFLSRWCNANNARDELLLSLNVSFARP